jgi:putative hydroxymethylpyrimidine transport system substrate-binding protein
MRPLLLVALVAFALAGCGGSGGGEVDASASLLLDFTPNAVHTGIYVARARGFDTGEGVRLAIRVPSSSTDAVRLLAAGRVDFAVLDIHDLGLARERGRDLVGVMGIVQRPLASVLTAPDIRSPRRLEGRRVGITGVPSDTAVLRSVVSGAGGDPARVRTVTIGFQAVQALLARRVAGATAFWNAEGVALRRRRPGYHVFRVDDFGAPSYPELVLCVTRRTLRERPETVDAVVRALRRGYEQVLDDPEGGIADLLARAHGDRKELEAELGAVQGAFRPPGGEVGELDRGRLRAWARWDVRFGILTRRPDIERAFRLSG